MEYDLQMFSVTILHDALFKSFYKTWMLINMLFLRKLVYSVDSTRMP